MAGITINGPGDVALVNCVHLGTLKSIDKASSLLKGPHKVLLEVRHGNGTSIVNTNIKSIGIKLIVERMVAVVGCTSNAGYEQRFTGGQKYVIVIDAR